jgi:hypothetical protein
MAAPAIAGAAQKAQAASFTPCLKFLFKSTACVTGRKRSYKNWIDV